MDIAHCIKKGREKKGWTQDDLAKSLGKSRNIVYFWESGKTIPTGDILCKLALELDIVEDLFPGYVKKSTIEQRPQERLLSFREFFTQVLPVELNALSSDNYKKAHYFDPVNMQFFEESRKEFDLYTVKAKFFETNFVTIITDRPCIIGLFNDSFARYHAQYILEFFHGGNVDNLMVEKYTYLLLIWNKMCANDFLKKPIRFIFPFGSLKKLLENKGKRFMLSLSCLLENMEKLLSERKSQLAIGLLIDQAKLPQNIINCQLYQSDFSQSPGYGHTIKIVGNASKSMSYFACEPPINSWLYQHYVDLANDLWCKSIKDKDSVCKILHDARDALSTNSVKKAIKRLEKLPDMPLPSKGTERSLML